MGIDIETIFGVGLENSEIKELPSVKKQDIEIFMEYIENCMDKVAVDNSDWCESYEIALKCMKYFADTN